MWWWSAISKLILDYIGDPQTFILIVLIAAVILWWHKEMKTGWFDYSGDLVNRLEKTIQVYSALEISILYYLRNPLPEGEKEIMLKLGQDNQYFSQSLYGAAAHFIRYRSIEQLEICLAIIQEESPKLRSRYLESVPNPHNSTDSTTHFFNVAFKILKPVILTLFSITLVAFYFATVHIAVDYTFGDKVAVMINLLVVTVLGLLLISLVVDEDFRRRVKWRVMSVLLFSGVVTLLLTPWYVKVIILVIGAAGVHYLDKQLRKNEKFDEWKHKGSYL